ncbi:sugar ABC transporter substrate-binding protein [Agromyces tropicus]|uniref:Sugar ABC transporter substrate-binding protein n=1 Tax=Agromyces tropicus TaxID=555371 RepID=A0ABN2UFC6_9MICO
MRTTALAGVGLVAATALALTGCAAGDSSGEADGPVTISYTNFISNGGNEENLQAIVDAFEAENPDITVEVTTLPYADYGTALQTDLAAGTVSDVFDIEYANFAQYQANGVLAEIDVEDPSVYRQSVLEAYQADGAQYALPSSFSTVVLFYNRDLFEAAGVDTPTGDWTWSDEQAAAEQLTDEGAGVWGDHQPVSFYEFYKVLAQNGGEFLDADGTAVAFNTPEGVEAAEWLVGKSGTTMPTIEDGQGTPDFDTNLFLDGKLAMLHTGIWMFGAFADAPFGWDIAVEPGNAQQASALFSNAVGVSAGSEHQDAAATFAEFLTSSDVMVQTRLDAGWELPATSDEAALESYLTLGNPENRQAVFDSLEQVALPPVVAQGQQEMQDIMTEELVEAQAGRKTVQEALDSAEERINAAIGG